MIQALIKNLILISFTNRESINLIFSLNNSLFNFNIFLLESSISAFDLKEYEEIMPSHWVKVLHLMINVVKMYGGAQLQEGTILDVLVAVEKAITPLIKRNASNKILLQTAAEAAECASGKTSFRKKQRFAGPDPEAQRITIFIRALNEAFKLVY